MSRRTFFAFLKEPPVYFASIVWALMFAAVGGAIACVATETEGILPYCIYAISAIVLGYSVYLAVRLAPKMKAGILARAHEHTFTKNLVTNYGFRTAAFAAIGFAVNVGYALFHGAMAIVSQSVWFATFALYYLLLSGLRIGILAAGRSCKKKFAGDEAAQYSGKLEVYRGSGIALLPLEIALGAAVSLMVLRQDPMPHSEIAAIASAAYAFYKIILAVVNLCKVRKMDDPTLQALRNIGLTDAAVSLFALQTTLVSVFSGGDEERLLPLNAAVGFCVCALALGLGIWMIVRSYQLQKRRNNSREREQGQI